MFKDLFYRSFFILYTAKTSKFLRKYTLDACIHKNIFLGIYLARSVKQENHQIFELALQYIAI